MSVLQQQMESRLRSALAPERLRLRNESDHHNVPPGSELHWNVIIVAACFAGQSLVQRHRAVHAALGDEINKQIHALSMKTLTPAEWQAAGGQVANPAPPCLGGSKADPVKRL